MGKKKPHTPISQIKNSLRRMWLMSRERNRCIKESNNTCAYCNKKGSSAKGREVKIHVHHKEGIEWQNIIDLIYQQLLVTPDKLECVCESCHKEKHMGD